MKHITTMNRRQHTPEPIIGKLGGAEKLLAEAKTLEEVSRHLEIT
jgi:hypothetical protein